MLAPVCLMRDTVSGNSASAARMSSVRVAPPEAEEPRHHAQVLPFETGDTRIRRPAHSRGALGDDVHHGLEVGRRARDDPQDPGRGGLLLERLFRLVEQADVLDGDDGLVGEGLKERDVVVRERLGLASADADHSERPVFPEYRDKRLAAVAHDPGYTPPVFCRSEIARDIIDLDAHALPGRLR